MVRALAALLTAAFVVVSASTVTFLFRFAGRSEPFRAFIARVWARVIILSCGVRIVVDGSEHIAGDEPRFFVGNHQSALDIPILFAALRGRTRFMAKESLFRIPAFGYLIRQFGFIPIDRTNARRALESIKEMLATLKRNPVSMIVFPEGTRSVEGKLLPFRKGTLKICQRAGFSVVPFAISGSAAVHRGGEYRVRPGTVRLRFSEPIPANEVAAMTDAELHDRVRGMIQESLSVISTERSAEASTLRAAETS